MTWPAVPPPMAVSPMYASGQGGGGSGGGGSTGPAFRAYRNGSQSTTPSVFTKVQFNAESFDTASGFDSSTNYRFTPNVAGYYQFNWLITAHGAATMTNLSARLYKNGTNVAEGTYAAPVGADGRSGGADLVYMNGSTDYVEVHVFIGQATPTVLGGDAAQSYFSGFYAHA